MSKNRLRKIPDEIRHLTSLKVLSLMHNKIEDLPFSMCDMTQLQIIKMSNNPMRFRLKNIVEKKGSEMDVAKANENEKEIAITLEIKKYLRESQPVITPVDADSGGESSESTIDTPKPLKRVLSGRFPVIPSTSGTESSTDLTMRSPNIPRPPPIPMKSHYRQASGQSGSSIRRPGANPISSPGNERNRSNSESVLQASAAARSKRMAMKKMELETVNESKARRNSHFRGLSHGSVLKMKASMPGSGSSSSPNSPRDRRRQRFAFARRLSSLPEQKQDAGVHKPLIEGAKGILYALFQLDPHVAILINIIKRDESKRNSLEMVYEFAMMHVEHLNHAIDECDRLDNDDDEEALEHGENQVRRLAIDCIASYKNIASQLQRNAKSIVGHGNIKYIRTFLITLYGSMIEMRNACSELGATINTEGFVPVEMTPERLPSRGVESRPQTANASTPTRDQPQRPGLRLRSETAIQHPTIKSMSTAAQDQNSRTGVARQVTASANVNNVFTPAMNNGYAASVARSRSNSRTSNWTLTARSAASSANNTPRSGDTFVVPPAPSAFQRNPLTGLSDTEEERAFEEIYIALVKAHEAAQQSLPIVRRNFNRALQSAEDNNLSSSIKELWSNLIYRCKHCLDVSEALNSRLLNMKIKDPNGGRNQREFWQTCKAFLQSFIDLVTEMREAKNLHLLSPEIVIVLRPVQRTSREAGKLIDSSPWGILADVNEKGPLSIAAQSMATNGIYGSANPMAPPPLPLTTTNYHSQLQNQQFAQAYAGPSSGQLSMAVPVLSSSASPSPATLSLPATPLSAALGPAAQATVPSTPASAYGDQFFAGNVFQRADSFLRMQQDPSLTSYRTRS